MPRIQERLLIDKATGDATVTREVLPDAPLAERIRDLKATVPARMDADPDAVRRAVLRCDGCQVTAQLDWDDPRAPDGWTERDEGDFCPACS